MKILSVNAGSSSLKFTLLELPEKKVIVSGAFEKIGLDNGLYTIKYNGEKIKEEAVLKDHTVAVKILLDKLIDLKIISSYDEIEGIGHRIVHGGINYKESVLVTDEVIKDLEDLIPLAPLHNPAHVVGIKSFKEVLPNTPMVVVFDTAFHQTMDKEEYLYAVPYEWFEKYGVRRYGFHGTSHRYIANKMFEHLGEHKKIINCHIGNGSSICAIKNGKCVATSMGFTPMAGLVMGTRCGDIDVSMIPYVMKESGITFEEIMEIFNKKSGILALSGVSSDMRDVEEAYLSKDPRCVTAMNIYVKKIVEYIVYYNCLLEGADYITFTAGVGENSDVIRQLVISRLKYMNVNLDESKNTGLRGKFEVISSEDSTIKVMVVPTDEELMIATDTYNLINK